MKIERVFREKGVPGATDLESRPELAALLEALSANGVRVVLIEDATRFARDLIAQELGIVVLVSRGVKVITANGDDPCDTSDPSRVMMRQIAGAFAQYEKARLVAMQDRARGHHLGVEHGIGAQQTMEVPAVPVRPIHHRGNA